MPVPPASELGVAIHFEGEEGVDAGTFAAVVRDVDRALLEIAVEDLRALRRQAVAPELAIDAAIGRAQDYRGSALRIDSASSGSIILFGAAGALTLWLLEHTVGKTLEEAWADSLLHRTLRDWLSSRLDSQATKAAARISRLLARRGLEAQVMPLPAPPGQGPSIDVRIPASPARQEPAHSLTMQTLRFKDRPERKARAESESQTARDEVSSAEGDRAEARGRSMHDREEEERD